MCDDPSHHHDGDSTRDAVARLAPRPVEGEAWNPVALEPVDQLRITTLVDNSFDALLTPMGPATRGHSTATTAIATLEGAVGADGLRAEHGFSALVTVTKGNRTRTLLFDTGVSPFGMVENMRRLDLDPGSIEAVVCSHGHFDHTAGFMGLAERLGVPNLPVLLHPEFWNRRRVVVAGRDPITLPTSSRRAIEELGFSVLERRDPSFVLDDSVLITGEVDRATDFERGFRGHERWRDDVWQDDAAILDDQALVANVRGKGLVVLTGCGHAGIVNITRYAQRLTGVDKVYAVIGGFHLSGPMFEPVIRPTVDALTALKPDVVVPAHCTGWRASHALAAAMPSAFIPNSVGTSFTLAA